MVMLNNDKIVMLGGFNGASFDLNDVWRFDCTSAEEPNPITMSWDENEGTREKRGWKLICKCFFK